MRLKTFAQLIGCTIEVESAVGAGTTFTVRLPVVAPAEGIEILEDMRGGDVVPRV